MLLSFCRWLVRFTLCFYVAISLLYHIDLQTWGRHFVRSKKENPMSAWWLIQWLIPQDSTILFPFFVFCFSFFLYFPRMFYSVLTFKILSWYIYISPFFTKIYLFSSPSIVIIFLSFFLLLIQIFLHFSSFFFPIFLCVLLFNLSFVFPPPFFLQTFFAFFCFSLSSDTFRNI